MEFSSFKPHQVLILLILSGVAVKSESTDRTLEEGATGEDVVDAVIARIGKFFGDDFGFFKNLAYVATEFGNKPVTGESHGGIWRISEEQFNVSKYTKVKNYNGVYKNICKLFGYRWRKTVIYEQLNKPLMSALALHLYLHITDLSKHANGFPQTVPLQETYCAKYLSLNIPTGYFQKQVEKFEKERRSCSAKIDLVVVLDGSGSVGHSDFQKSLEFVSNTFQLYNTKMARLGFIVYSDTVDVHISLTNQMSIQQIQNKVLASSYPAQWTATGDGIIAALNLFTYANDRKGVPRIMAVFTDGESNRGTTSVTSAMTRASSMKVTSYAVGIGGSTRLSELREIAMNDDSRLVDIKNYDNLQSLFRNIHTKTCEEPQTPSPDDVTEDELESNQTRVYKVPQKIKDRSLHVYAEATKGNIICLKGRHKTVNLAYNDGELPNCEGSIEQQKSYPNQRRRRSDVDLGNAYGDETIDIPDEFYVLDTVFPDFESNEVEMREEGGGLNAAVKSSKNYYIAVIGLEPVNEYTIRFRYIDADSATTTTTTTTTTTSSTTNESTSTTTSASPTTITTPSTSVITTTSPPTTTIRSTATTTAPATQTIPDYDGTLMLSNSPTDTEAPSTISVLGVGTIPTTTPRTATTDMQTSERPINGTVKNAPEPKSHSNNMGSTLSQRSNGSSVFENWIIFRILLVNLAVVFVCN